MHNVFNNPFDPGSRTLRENGLYQVSTDAEGRPVIEAVEGNLIALSAHGSIGSFQFVSFFHCGHATSEGIGGQCGEGGCTHVSCRRCFAEARCALCSKPLCLEHMHLCRFETETTALKLCGRCLAEVKRRRYWGNLLRGILSPFIERDGRRSS